jgi:hypothetical protein
VKDALKEYVNADGGNATKRGLNMFFEQAGAAAVIRCRRDRAKREEHHRIGEPIATLIASIDSRITIWADSKIELGKLELELKPTEEKIVAVAGQRGLCPHLNVVV